MRSPRDVLVARCAAIAIAAIGAGVPGCGRDDAAVTSRAAPEAPSAAAPSTDVAVPAFEALVARTERAFEREGDALVARGSRPTAPFVASVSAGGELSFDPSWAAASRLRLRLRAARADAAPLVALSSDRAEVVISRGAPESFDEEHLESTGDSLEQSWRYARPPSSPPIVRLATSGMRYVGETSSGHHFVDDATGLGVRYGRASWIDAAGRRTDVKVSREGDELVMRVPEEAARGPYPATLDPTLSPEQGIDQPVAMPTRRVDDVSLAAGPADTHLVAWLDRGYEGSPAFVRAARLAADGTLLGAPATLMVGASSVSVAWDGARWLVVADGDAGARFVRIAANGAVVDATARVIPGASRAASVAYDGSKFVVVSRDDKSPGTIRALRIDGATGVVDPTKAVTITTKAEAGQPAVACGGATTGCAVHWRSGSRPMLTRLSGADIVLDPDGLDLGGSGTSEDGALASDGSQWLVTWGEFGAIQVARVSADGTITAASGTGTAAIPTSFETADARSVTWDGANFTALWFFGGVLRAQRFDPMGALVGGVVAVESSSSGRAAFVASGASRLLVTGRPSPTLGLYSRAFTSALVPLADATLLTPGSNAQTNVIAAYNGSTFLVLWDDNRQTPGSGRYAARLDATGAPLDAVGTRLTFSPQALASDGDGFLGVGGSGGGQAVRFSKSSATPLDALPFTIADDKGFEAPEVAFDGQNYLVVWASKKTENLTDYDVRAARVSPAGVVLDPTGFVLSAANDQQRLPRVASNGKGALVVWWDCRVDYYLGDIFGTRVSQSGQVQDPDGLPIAKRGSLQIDPNVTAEGDDYAVVFLDTLRTGWNSGFGDYDLYGTRVRGGVVDPVPVEIRRRLRRGAPLAASARDGVSTLVAWNDLLGTGASEIGVATGAWMGRAPAFDLLEVTPLATPQSSIGSVLPTAPGRVAVFYSAFVEAEGALRAKLRFADTGAKAGTSCAAATECQTRYCSDGACCVETCDGVCRRCGGAGGTCEAVRSADDPDTCAGDRTCDANGACKKKNGSVCEQGSDCASGFCVDSFCCEVACSGACETCSEVRGSCTVRARGSLGTPSCSPNRCDGQSRACAAECLTDGDCADGFGCDRPSRTCVAGSVCSDSSTVRDVSGASKSCAPYACQRGACVATCEKVQDCAFPAVCNEDRRCVAVPGARSAGCELAAPGAPSQASARAGVLVALAAAYAARARRRRKA